MAAHPRIPAWNSQLILITCKTASSCSLTHMLHLIFHSVSPLTSLLRTGYRASIFLLPASNSLVQLPCCLDEQTRLFMSNMYSWGQADSTRDSIFQSEALNVFVYGKQHTQLTMQLPWKYSNSVSIRHISSTRRASIPRGSKNNCPLPLQLRWGLGRSVPFGDRGR